MKAWKYIAITLSVVMILLVAGWFLRNTLIEQISNPMLEEYELTVTDVSLDALATGDADISYLELQHVNGMTISIEDLRLPIQTSRTGFKNYSAGKISIGLPTVVSDEPPDLAAVFGQLLALPQQLPQTIISVGEINAPPYPTIRDLHWRLTQNEQELTVFVGTFLLTTSLARVSDTGHLLSISYADAADTSTEQSIVGELRRGDEGVSLNGTGTLDLRLLSSMIALFGIDTVSVESGLATVIFDGEIGDDPNQIPIVYADFTATTPILLNVAGITDVIRSVTVESASTIEVSATITDLQWSLRQPQMSLRVADSGGNDFAVSLTNLSCESTPACSADVGIRAEDLTLPFADVEQFELSATQDIEMREDGAHIIVRPNATAALSGIAGPDLEMARFDAQLTSEGEFDLTGTDWQVSAASVDAAVGEYVVYDGLAFSAPVYLDDIVVRQAGRQQSAKIGFYASAGTAHWNGQRIQLPGFKGGIARDGAEVAVFLETDGLFEEASLEASHNLDNENGQMSLTGAGISFDSQQLSARVSPWQTGWDISAGTIGIAMQATWQRADDDWQVTAATSVRATNITGAWEDTAFAGLTTSVDAEIDTMTGITVQPSSIEVALVEMGLPVEDITADYTLRPDELSVDVENLRMSAFGGTIWADPFSFSTAGESNNLLIHAESIDLAKIPSIREFEAIEISGSIGAELPVTIEGQTLTISGGTLTGNAPGGVIRYLPGIESDQTDVSGIGFATRALSNFEYDTLTSEVNYGTNGDLVLQMRLSGRNPDLEEGRPIILNLGIENNVPQMLRSLQAARAVEEILERRLAQ
jgi:hypothetical protein